MKLLNLVTTSRVHVLVYSRAIIWTKQTTALKAGWSPTIKQLNASTSKACYMYRSTSTKRYIVFAQQNRYKQFSVTDRQTNKGCPTWHVWHVQHRHLASGSMFSWEDIQNGHYLCLIHNCHTALAALDDYTALIAKTIMNAVHSKQNHLSKWRNMFSVPCTYLYTYRHICCNSDSDRFSYKHQNLSFYKNNNCNRKKRIKQ